MAVEDAHQHGHGVDADAPRTSIEDHRQTFDAFMGFVKWGVIVVVAILIGMAVFLL